MCTKDNACIFHVLGALSTASNGHGHFRSREKDAFVPGEPEMLVAAGSSVVVMSEIAEEPDVVIHVGFAKTTTDQFVLTCRSSIKAQSDLRAIRFERLVDVYENVAGCSTKIETAIESLNIRWSREYFLQQMKDFTDTIATIRKEVQSAAEAYEKAVKDRQLQHGTMSQTVGEA